MLRAGQTYEQCRLHSRGFITACDMISNINYQAAKVRKSRFQTAHTFGKLGVMFETNLFQRNAQESVMMHFFCMFLCSVAEGMRKNVIHRQLCAIKKDK